MTALIVHGHFYQPPRENPWTGNVEREFGADPYHDWNERIHAECYGPNAFARIMGPQQTIERTVNNYSHISFDFGPTLLSWLERHHSKTYERVLEADRESAQKRSGHGNAIAHAYGHAILPLCNDQDRLTQVLWGLEDFRYRFRREPESLWLPETACNNETLDLLIEHRLRFVILAPDQAERYKPANSDQWHAADDCSIDTTRAYLYLHQDGSGRSLAVFFYNGAVARAIAFEQALISSQTLVWLFKQAGQGALVNVATDGESYGHHFNFGDLSLAHAMEIETSQEGFWVTNYGQFLDLYPAEAEVRIKQGFEGEGTSWSCAHGVGRWIRDCGCHTGGQPGWNQSWRGPLRKALDFLRDEAAKHFERVGGELLIDPWGARNASIELILDHNRSREEFLIRHARKEFTPEEAHCALTLLELQRNSLLMYTSCGWFFSDVSGIETIQVMKYAARVIELMHELGLPSPRERFLELMAEAKSNIRHMETGANIYLRYAEPPSLSLQYLSAVTLP
ncbi:MAG: DUF3536 domain-containing protein [Pyrinomonadaceae bacterium]|nr:DUF3536 domain-containing protein [Pyrinomonadaceae bacterium]